MRLFTIPVEKMYESKWGYYQVPQVSPMGITDYFQLFREKYHYGSICVAMRRDAFYGESYQRMFTLKKKKNIEKQLKN